MHASLLNEHWHAELGFDMPGRLLSIKKKSCGQWLKQLQITKDAFQQLLGKEPKVAAIHAGLECGIIGEKVPGMDAVSYGPTITGAHSPDEQVTPKAVCLA